MTDIIALVDDRDEIIGYADKLDVHRSGKLHRAFSIVVYNSNGEMLLQRRALDKYHSAGLWTNTCCSHLPKGKEMDRFIHDRLEEEMGFDCDLKYVKTFSYRIDFGNGLIENEVDHIYVGVYDGDPDPSIDEVCEWAWFDEQFLLADINVNPQNYTYWFKIILENHLKDIRSFRTTC